MTAVLDTAAGAAGAPRPRRRHARLTRLALALAAVTALVVGVSPPAQAAPSRINGSGSSYVALAMQQWVADAQSSGLQINYLPTGSPAGLTQFGSNLADFAGTEAEYSALGGTEPARGFQYIPDVAGAVAIMYNVEDKAKRKVDYLHLSRLTVARIFTGDIAFWDDPAISADTKLPNGNLVLPHEPITVVYRQGQSGTTALFYDFVQKIAPDVFNSWAARNQFPTSVRIVALDSSPNFAPKAMALNGSDQIAQYLGSPAGKWAIGYDEFGYAKTYNVTAAWIENESKNWVLPYAQNIASALESATLRPDLSQELSKVYTSPKVDAYPISAYSYVVTQCANAPDRATCKGPYVNPGSTETLTKWLRYVACEGQTNMARIGYSPLPPHLSQEIANAIGRLNGSAAEHLDPGNCANPTFKGSLGSDSTSPKEDPTKLPKTVDPTGPVNPGGGSGPAGVGPTSGGGPDSGPVASGGPGNVTKSQTATNKAGNVVSQAPGATVTTVGSDASAPVAASDGGQLDAAGPVGAIGASRQAKVDWKAASPIAYDRPGVEGGTVVPLLCLALMMLVPPLVGGARKRFR